MRAWNYPQTLPWARNGQHSSTEFWYECHPLFSQKQSGNMVRVWVSGPLDKRSFYTTTLHNKLSTSLPSIFMQNDFVSMGRSHTNRGRDSKSSSPSKIPKKRPGNGPNEQQPWDVLEGHNILGPRAYTQVKAGEPEPDCEPRARSASPTPTCSDAPRVWGPQRLHTLRTMVLS